MMIQELKQGDRILPTIHRFSCAVLVFVAALSLTTNADDSVVTRPTFTRDVLPVLQEHCQECHRPGQVAPISFMSYDEVRPWAKAIRKATETKTMPPFHASGPLDIFQNDLRLTEKEIQTIRNWVDTGAPEGSPKDAPPPRSWSDDQWQIHEPDLVLSFSSYPIRPDVEDEFVMFYSPHVFAEDTWFEAIEFQPSDRRFVHHAGIFAVDDQIYIPESRIWSSLSDGPEDPQLNQSFKQATTRLLSQNFLYTWLPGYGPHRLPEGQAIKVNKGESILVQSHFAPSIEEGECEMRVALQFYDGVVSRSTHSIVSLMRKLEIPPGEPSYVYRQTIPVKDEARVYAYNAHMHLRGRSTQFILHPPNESARTLFEVPRYDFDWQRVYVLNEPLTIPAGSRIEYVAEWDNSPQNPLNPDPNQTVIWGQKTTDEMYGGTILYTRDLDTPFTVENGIMMNPTKTK